MATLFFALGNAILIIPLGLLPSWLALASTGFDVLLLGVAVAVWDAFDEGQALRADMLRSFAGSVAVAVLFGGQALIGLAITRQEPTAQSKEMSPSKSESPAQPIPYSHKKHLSFGMRCQQCHPNPEPGDRMTIPAAAKYLRRLAARR